MSSKEWARLILVSIATNGWWAASQWPELGASILLVLAVLSTLALVVWVSWALADGWGNER